jgi:hypothetical protein
MLLLAELVLPLVVLLLSLLINSVLLDIAPEPPLTPLRMIPENALHLQTTVLLLDGGPLFSMMLAELRR